MEPGRKRIPKHLQVIRGTERNEPPNRSMRVPVGNLKPPPHLDREARAEWRRRVGELVELGIFGDRDRALLATWCSNWSRLVRAERTLAELGDVHVTANGYPVPRPELAITAGCAKTLERLAGHFGFSPISRQRLDVPIQPPLLPKLEGSRGPSDEEIEKRFFGE